MGRIGLDALLKKCLLRLWAECIEIRLKQRRTFQTNFCIYTLKLEKLRKNICTGTVLRSVMRM